MSVAGLCQSQDPKISDADRRLAQETAQRFIRKIQTTRDVQPLLNEFLGSRFIPLYACESNHTKPGFYHLMSEAERRRLFIVHINDSYLWALDILNGIPGSARRDTDYSNILPPEIAGGLRGVLRSGGRPVGFADYDDFRDRLPRIENELSKARIYLTQHPLEKTPSFQKRLDDTITGQGINYSVEPSYAGWLSTVCCGVERCPSDTEIFIVQTPLFWSLRLRKQMVH